MTPHVETELLPSRTGADVTLGRVDVVTTTSHSPPGPSAAGWGLALVWVIANLAYLLLGCPHELAPDEAHYWQWSRVLDWSYYSKGPLVALLIRGGCELFGGWSTALVGDESVAVRLPAVLCSGLLLAGVHALALQALGSGRLAAAAVGLLVSLPLVSAGAMIMTTDAPFLAAWAWALVFVGRALDGSKGWAWAAAGGCAAVGALAKYPMLLLPAAVCGYLAVHQPREFRRAAFWWFPGLAAAACVPMAAWAAAHDWVSLRHALGQTGIGDGVRERAFRVEGALSFIGGQAAVLVGFWFVAFVAAGLRWRPAAGAPGAHPLMWWATYPVWGVFLVGSLRNPGQLNWPVAAYVGGAVLAVAWVGAELNHPIRWRRRVTGIGLTGAVGVGVAASLWLRFPQLVRPALAAAVGAPTAENPTPLRRLDPTCRLTGWRALASEVDRIRERVRSETGREPVLAGMLWSTPGELAFYCRGRPTTFSFGLALADRHSQYDVWRPNPVADPEAFRGATVIYIGDEIPHAEGGVFGRVEPPVRVVHLESGSPAAAWGIWVGHDFRGLPDSLRLKPRDY